MPRFAVVVPLLCALLLCGCGGSTGEGSPEPAASPTSEPTPTPSGERSSARGGKGTGATDVPDSLDFTATTVGGERFEGASLAGRPALLWFWAPWCPVCRSQVPQVEGLAAEHRGELNVVGVGSLDSAEAIAEFAGDVDGLTHLEDTEGELWRRFGVKEQSSFVLLDTDGSVAFEAGYGGSDELGERVAGVVG